MNCEVACQRPVLAGKPAFGEEVQFLRRRYPPQHRIAMRETPEAANDVAVQFGKAQVFQVAQQLEHRHRALLVLQAFRVFERQVNEGAQLRRQLAVQPILDGAHGVMPRQPVGGKGVRSATETVARELVQQDLQGQRALGGIQPFLVPALGSGEMRVDEAPSELEPIIHALNAYIEKLGQTLSAYEKFVSDTAHHLRTSFAIIQSQVDFGRRNAGNPAIQADTFDSIQKTMAESTKLVNQFLVLASVEQTANDRNSDGAIRLTEAITCVIEEMAPLALRKDISLGVDRFDDSLLIAAKPHFVREIFSNLIDNSIQHMGRPGSVTITLEREGQLAHCRLTDDGVGIPPPLLDRIFERFFRADTSQSGRSGLGLAIVKEICDALGATIQASIPSSGAGVQFDLFFPLIPGKPQ